MSAPGGCVPEVLPPEGWNVQSRFGLLRFNETTSGRLARLEDVAELLLARELPRDRVVGAIFGALIGDDGAEARHLYLLKANTYAVPLVERVVPAADGNGWVAARDWRVQTSEVGPPSPRARPPVFVVSPKAAEFWRRLPGLHAGSYDEDVARCIADGWLRVWRGRSDPSTDHGLLASFATAGIAATALSDAGLYSGGWPADELLWSLLQRLAVPLSKAAELWGYARMPVPTAVPAPQLVATPMSPFPLADFAALVAYRAREPKPSWADGNQIELVKAEMERRGADAVAEDFGISRQGLTNAVSRERKRMARASPLPTVAVVAGQRGRR